MKVVSPSQMHDLEQQAYRDGSSDQDFMEEAGSGVGLVVHEFAEKYGLEHQVILLCGKGNNAGDAYVAGIHLLHLDYHVHAYQLFPLSECSKLCQQNASRFVNEGGILTEVGYDEEIHYPPDGLIVDGLFGTGFKGPVEEPLATRIREANETGLPILSIDIPSGLNGETGKMEGPTILATETAFLGLPKLGFFINEGWNVVGKLHAVDFGLNEEYLEELASPLEMLTDEMMLRLLPSIKRSRHKYEAGYVVGVAGSPGLSGAAILSSYAALRSGAGIVRLFYPRGMEVELSSCPAEIIKTSYENKLDALVKELERASSFYIGPGIGTSSKARNLIDTLLPHVKVPTVIDADALNLYAEKEFPLPEKTILTPHLGEAHRLLKLRKATPIDNNFLQKCQQFVDKKQITLIIKGGPTFIFHPELPIHVNPCGDPGMATAGTGDVLTGMIASLLAQGLSPHDAACLGVYLHGCAGEQAALELTPYCMVASDLFDFFPNAFSFATRI